MVLDQGGLFNDVKNIVLVINTHSGVVMTTVEALVASNSTSADNGSITYQGHLRSIGNTRLLLFTLFSATALWRSIHSPAHCLILQNSAHKLIIGGVAAADPTPQALPGQANEAVGAAPQGMPQVQRGEQQRQQQQLVYCMSSYCEEQDDEEFAPGMIEPAYERVALDVESEATVNRLRDDDEVIVFMPAEETVIPDGPKRCVLCFLLGGNHRAAKRINDFAEEHKAWTQVGELGLFVGILALLEVIPLSLTWLSVFSLGDTCRCFFLLNARAVNMCISESVDFMVPFVSIIVGLLAGAASWDFHPGVCAFAICFGGFYITQILFGA
jgi:hypothetical protein